MQEVYRILARLMNTDLGVMITGESGTGKELVARALHNYGLRKAGPFVAINMAAIPRDLIESELFGHEKGAFTGADRAMAGKFEQARGGTLFLDEVGDMPLDAQTRLLRVLQEGEYTRVGGREVQTADVRIVAATHQDLRGLINEGRFREDLFYRLNVVPIRLPPLRERLEDVPDLARAFLRKAETEGLPRKSISKEALDILKKQEWTGNVRELENLMRRLCVLCPDDVISGAVVTQEISARPSSAAAPQAAQPQRLAQAIEAHLRRYFDLHGDSLPPDGLYDRILKEMELPLIALVAVGDPRQPGAHRRAARHQPEHAAQKDQGPRHSGYTWQANDVRLPQSSRNEASRKNAQPCPDPRRTPSGALVQPARPCAQAGFWTMVAARAAARHRHLRRAQRHRSGCGGGDMLRAGPARRLRLRADRRRLRRPPRRRDDRRAPARSRPARGCTCGWCASSPRSR